MLTIPFVHALPAPVPTTTTVEGFPQANLTIVATTSGTDMAWYQNSGATNHFSHGIPLVYGAQPFSGSGKLQVAKGNFLNISILVHL